MLFLQPPVPPGAEIPLAYTPGSHTGVISYEVNYPDNHQPLIPERSCTLLDSPWRLVNCTSFPVTVYIQTDVRQKRYSDSEIFV